MTPTASAMWSGSLKSPLDVTLRSKYVRVSDHVVAAAMIDRIVHHADVLTLKGNSYRLRNTNIDTLPSHRISDKAQ